MTTARAFRTKELSKRTWGDFERLFSQGNGWDFCWCLAYQFGASGGRSNRRPDLIKRPRNRSEWNEVNHAAKADLVESGEAHGILVYDGDDPIGWCQYGQARELPLGGEVDASRDDIWKITCFVTLKSYRARGVATTALHAAVEAIAKKGGGRVEGYPYAVLSGQPAPGPRDQVVYRDGDVTYYSGREFSVDGVMIDGVGAVTAVYWRSSGMFHAGTVAMFEKEGFRPLRVLPTPPNIRSPWGRASRVVMEKFV